VVKLKPSFEQRLLEAGEKDEEWKKIREAVGSGGGSGSGSGSGSGKTVDSLWSVENGVLMWKDRWFIPNNEPLRLSILKDNHDSRAADHFGIHKTLERIKQNYPWINLDADVTDYVRSCYVCQRDKPCLHKK
jgi:hypothetical protein